MPNLQKDVCVVTGWVTVVMNNLNLRRCAPALFAVLLVAACSKEKTQVFDAWARTTAPGQKVGAAYLTIESPVDSLLVKVESPLAAEVELHDMRIENGVMQMRPLDALELPAGKPVKLEAGGRHLMLLDIARPLVAGAKLPLKLTLQRRDGGKEVIETVAEVRAASQ